MKQMPLIILIAVVVVAIAACEISIWNECRASNSWIYCMRVTGK